MQSKPMLCSQTPLSNDNGVEGLGALDYTIGTVDDWVEHLGSDGDLEVARYLTPCSAPLLHGTFALGSRPSAALFTDPLTSRASLAVARGGFPEGGSDTGSCGLPIEQDGVVVDSWNMPGLLSIRDPVLRAEG